MLAVHPPPRPARPRPPGIAAKVSWGPRLALLLTALAVGAIAWFGLRGTRGETAMAASGAPSTPAGADHRDAGPLGEGKGRPKPGRETPDGRAANGKAAAPTEDIRPEDRAAVDALLR